MIREPSWTKCAAIPAPGSARSPQRAAGPVRPADTRLAAERQTYLLCPCSRLQLKSAFESSSLDESLECADLSALSIGGLVPRSASDGLNVHAPNGRRVARRKAVTSHRTPEAERPSHEPEGRPALRDAASADRRMRWSCVRFSVRDQLRGTGVLVLLLLALQLLSAASVQAAAQTVVQVVGIQGTNWWIAPNGATAWVMASTRMPQPVRVGDRIRTGRHTRLFLQTTELGVVQIPPLSTIEITAPPDATRSVWFRLADGLLYLFHRGSPSDVEVHTRGASAAIRGTEFVAEARDDGGLIIRVIDGAVELSNAQGTTLLEGGSEGVAAAGRAPARTAAIRADRTVQWCLYYPGVLDPDELSFSPAQKADLRAVLDAYRAGDLVGALANYPDQRTSQSPDEQVFHAALLLAVGEVEKCEPALQAVETGATGSSPAIALAGAVRRVIGAVRDDVVARPGAQRPALATEWLAESYALQAAGRLEAARAAARHATEKSPQFGFAWARLAELEFSFGRIDDAGAATQRALELSPRHAAAVALRGFEQAARHQTGAAEESFEHAIALDPALANGWLGRGLIRIRHGNTSGGLADLEVAAAVEPQRALLRSYLGKAFAAAGNPARARKELALARSMDPNDPTAWLYSALLHQDQQEINEAIRDVEKSKALNQNRQVYRSRHLLDQDQAVRGANLSALYRDALMPDVSRREAIDAVNTDYANYSAHLFLANSYNDLRDPGQLELRYETPWFNELLLANLLAPANAGTLSQTISSHEYSRLFERNRFSGVSFSEYRTGGDWRESAALQGFQNGFAFAVEADYRNLNGQRLNNDLEELTLSLKLKQDLGPRDSLYFQALGYGAEGGDLGRVYDPRDAAASRPFYRFEETQEPLLLLGHHHEWSPGQHTLILAGRLQDRLWVADSAQPILMVSKDPTNNVTATLLTGIHQRYRSDLAIYSLELQHIAQLDPLTLIAGARGQLGEFDTASRQWDLLDNGPALPDPIVQRARPDLRRLTAYGYGQWQVIDPLSLFAGVTYDALEYPANHRFAPVRADEDTRAQWSPKAGFNLKLTPASTLRGAYTRALSGASLDQSYRLEPSQVAGFNQSWRGLIPESVAGANAGARLENAALEWDYRLPTATYFSIRGDLNRSDLQRKVGVLDLHFFAAPSTTPEHLDFQEATLTVTLNQLIGRIGTVGAQYRLSNARLEDVYPQIPVGVPHSIPPYELKPRQHLESTLHQIQFYAACNHPSGLFAQADALWSSQANQGYNPARPGDDFWQFNLHAGYRLPARRAELRFSLLNLADQDYRLNPLNLTADLPRERTFVTSLVLRF